MKKSMDSDRQIKRYKKLGTYLVSSLFLFTVIIPGQAFSEEKTSQSYDSVEERRIYSLMQEERERVAQKERDLVLREKELKTLEVSVDKKIAAIDKKLEDLKKLQTRIEELLAEKSNEEKKRVKDLSTIYEKMVPERAAMAMTGMDPTLATDILSNMKPKAAAKVLNVLDKQKTSELSTTFTTIQLE